MLNLGNDLTQIGLAGGKGTLSVTSGGKVVNHSSGIYLGKDAGSSGNLIVSGAASQFISSDIGAMTIGDGGVGSVVVSSGGNVTVDRIKVAAQAAAGTSGVIVNGGTLTLTGTADNVVGAGGQGLLSLANNAVVASANNLVIGGNGMGTLSVLSGSVLNSKGATIGNLGTNSLATVTGNGSTWTLDGHLLVGYQGSGDVTVSDAGQINFQPNSWLNVGEQAGSKGVVTVTGNASSISVPNSQSIRVVPWPLQVVPTMSSATYLMISVDNW